MAPIISHKLLGMQILCGPPPSHPLPEVANTLRRMPNKKKASYLLAENLGRLMKDHPELDSSPKIAKKSGLGQKTVNNATAKRHDAKLSTLDGLARAFGTEQWALLFPEADKTLHDLARAYNQGDERDRAGLKIAANMVLQRLRESADGDTANQTKPPDS